MLSGLGRDRGLLCRDRALLALCRDRGLCRDKVWSRPGSLVSRHRNCLTIGWCDWRAACSRDRRAVARMIGTCARATGLGARTIDLDAVTRDSVATELSIRPKKKKK